MDSLPSVEFPTKLQCLFTPSRYKVLYGGRGGAKSWGAARAALLKGAQQPLRVLCARELQNSIKDSIHLLLSQQIYNIGMGYLYDIQQAAIKGTNGTEFNFEGIKNNSTKIRSYEGINLCILEEAVNISKESMTTLIPTVRKENSEFWILFNPKLEEDYIYTNFVKNPPPRVLNGKPWCIVQKVSWRDNPWFPDVLRQEMEELKAKDFDEYLHVWEGHCVQILEGAIYAQEMRDALAEGRITSVPWERSVPVDTFWDLGRANHTSIWFTQYVGFEYRILDFYQNRLQHIDHYLEVLQNKKYIYGNHWLPHDAKAKTLGTRKSIEEQIRAKFTNVRIVPKLSITDGIQATKSILPNCWFDESRCAEGLKCLKNYHYEVIPGTQSYSQNPVHDGYSDGADSFRMAGIGMGAPRKAPNLKLFQKVRERLMEGIFVTPGDAPNTEWMR